jgi:hypothetical protein
MADLIGGMLNTGSGLLSFAIILMAVLFLGGLVALGIYFYSQWKKYQEFKCIIWERDGFGQIRETYDMAGIFVDNKTHNKRFFLKKAKVGLQPDDVPYIPTAGNKKEVYLLRTGLKNFQFIKPVIDRENFKFSVTEEDVNWAINSYERQKKLFDSNLLMQLLPYIMLAFVSIIILILFIYFFKNFGVLKEVAVAFKDAAQALAQANSGQVVLQ